MKLYLSAETNIGYTPDWIQIEYIDSNTNQSTELTMGIYGEINYNPDTLDVYIKGDMVPWTQFSDGEEIDLSSLSEPEPYVDVFNKYIAKANEITLGFYPVMEEAIPKSEVIPKGVGEYRYIENGKRNKLRLYLPEKLTNKER